MFIDLSIQNFRIFSATHQNKSEHFSNTQFYLNFLKILSQIALTFFFNAEKVRKIECFCSESIRFLNEKINLNNGLSILCPNVRRQLSCFGEVRVYE